jgi:hypothetical protein
VFPVALREKIPARGWNWTRTAITEDLIEPTFAQTNNNIGVALDIPSDGLIDVDLD